MILLVTKHNTIVIQKIYSEEIAHDKIDNMSVKVHNVEKTRNEPNRKLSFVGRCRNPSYTSPVEGAWF